MSIDQETPESQVEAELEDTAVNDEHPHTEVAEHEYTLEELKVELSKAKEQAHENWDKALRTQAEMASSYIRKQNGKRTDFQHDSASTWICSDQLGIR